MRLATACSVSGLSVYCIIRREVDDLYFRPAPDDFGVWTVEALHRMALPEDLILLGQYYVVIDASGWDDGLYLFYYYHTGVAANQVIGTKYVNILGGEVVDSQSYDVLARIMGLCKDNMYIDQTVYSGGNMTSCRLRMFSTAPFAPGTDTPIATYRCTLTFTGTNMISWKMERE